MKSFTHALANDLAGGMKKMVCVRCADAVSSP